MNRLLKVLLIPLIALSLLLSTLSPAMAQKNLPGFMSQGQFVDALTGTANLTSWGMENLSSLTWGAAALMGGVTLPDGTIQGGARQQLMMLQAHVYNTQPLS